MNDKRICLNKSVLDFMADKLTPQSLVLEFGSGWSSRWFAERCLQLMTIETDSKWVNKVRADLHATGRTNFEVVHVSSNAEHFATEVLVSIYRWLGTSHHPDVVLVDCREDLRIEAAVIGWRILAPGGWLVFDDAQRKRHEETISWLTLRAGTGSQLIWAPGDVESARERLALAFCKPSTEGE